jgi:hypothetical protein
MMIFLALMGCITSEPIVNVLKPQYDCMFGHCLNESLSSLMSRGCQQTDEEQPQMWKCKHPFYVNVRAEVCSGVVVHIETHMNRPDSDDEGSFDVTHGHIVRGTAPAFFSRHRDGRRRSFASSQEYEEWYYGGQQRNEGLRFTAEQWVSSIERVMIEQGWYMTDEYQGVPIEEIARTEERTGAFYSGYGGKWVHPDRIGMRYGLRYQWLHSIHPQRRTLCDPMLAQDLMR